MDDLDGVNKRTVEYKQRVFTKNIVKNFLFTKDLSYQIFDYPFQTKC